MSRQITNLYRRFDGGSRSYGLPKKACSIVGCWWWGHCQGGRQIINHFIANRLVHLHHSVQFADSLYFIFFLFVYRLICYAS